MNYQKKVIACLLALAMTVTLVPAIQASAASKMQLNKTKATIYVGKTLKLKVKNKKKKKVTWKSTNKKVAKVTKQGRVTAIKKGKATITAKVGKKKLKCKIVVKSKTNTKPSWTTNTEEEGKVTQPETTKAANDATQKPTTVVPETTKEPVTNPPEPTTKQQATTKAPETTTKQPTTTKAPEPTTSISFTTDSSLAKPFGLVVSSPENGMVQVVWGAGSINCYNVYVDGERRRTGISAQSLLLPVYSEGTHTVSITTVVGSKESLKTEETINVVGVGEKETEPETCPEELKPQLRSDLSLSQEKILMQLNNKTNGKYSDSQVYWCLVGYNANKELCYLDKNGNLIPANTGMNNLTVNGRSVANVCYSLAESNYTYVPSVESARMYFSYEKPIYLTFNEAADGRVGFAGPDLNNSSDPNANTLFEFAEFTIDGKYYWGNTTRVDFFSFPMITRLMGHTQYEKYDKVVGDIGTRDEIFTQFKNGAPDAFKTLVGDKRIMAPCKTTFNTGQPYANYFDSYINEFWTKYTNEDLVFQSEGGKFIGRVSGNTIKFKREGDSAEYSVSKPTTQEVLEGKGAFDQGNSTEKAIEAQLCAAFNRGVATEPSKWNKVTQYYQNSINNYYAGFFHKHSVVGLAYGFCYDDVNDQSTLLQYGNSDALVIDLKW